MSSESQFCGLQRKVTFLLYKTKTLVQYQHGHVFEVTSTVPALSCPKVNIGFICQYLLTLYIMNMMRKWEAVPDFFLLLTDRLWHFPLEIKNFTELQHQTRSLCDSDGSRQKARLLHNHFWTQSIISKSTKFTKHLPVLVYRTTTSLPITAESHCSPSPFSIGFTKIPSHKTTSASWQYPIQSKEL